MTGTIGLDNRPILWLEVCKDGKKLWRSSAFADLSAEQYKFISDVVYDYLY